MLYAIKGNKQLKIDEAEKAAHLKLGYDIAKEVDGKLQVVAVSPAKTVPHAKYVALVEENAELKKSFEKSQGAELKKENAALAKENAALAKENAELKKQIEDLEKRQGKGKEDGSE